MNYFVLSTELLNILSESNDGRIVNVASMRTLAQKLIMRISILKKAFLPGLRTVFQS